MFPKGLVAGAVATAVGLGGVGGAAAASSPPATGPYVYASATCTTSAPYSTFTQGYRFTPNDDVSAIVVWSDGNSTISDTEGPFTAGQDGQIDIGQFGIIYADRPHTIGTTFFHDRNHDGALNNDDDIVAGLKTAIDQPCTDSYSEPK